MSPAEFGGVACPKPERGAAALERHAEKVKRKSHEKQVKAEVRKRDGKGCRWPKCPYWKRGVRVEAAHLEPAGMGGDPQGLRMRTDNLIRMCLTHHRENYSLHTVDLKIEPMTWKGADGPVTFYQKVQGKWIVVGVESQPGVLVEAP